ncbi:NUDIX hydrolase [Nocardioides litoris]|uniref:NUDIX hydrolase n=1 Tax=Nocardioides litoris TaxID=1926648 RepID=UPI00111FC339|nr:NUDIX domain-containing protein [Nocardioides litoris]
MSAHADALAVLRAWTPPSDAQAALRERYVAHLDAHPDGLSRGCRPDHLTASTLVLSADRTHTLLTLHAKARRWFQTGGHLEPDDPGLDAAALREATEESGVAGLALHPQPVHLDEHAVPFCRPPEGVADDGREVHHLDVRFVALAPAGASYAVSEESLDVRWWPVDALPEPDLEPLVAAALAALGTGGRGQSTGSNSDGGRTAEASDQPSR